MNHKEGLYDALLEDYCQKGEKFVKRTFIGSFYLAATSSQIQVESYVSEEQWLDAVSQFTKVIELKKQIEEHKTMPMPTALNMI